MSTYTWRPAHISLASHVSSLDTPRQTHTWTHISLTSSGQIPRAHMCMCTHTHTHMHERALAASSTYLGQLRGAALDLPLADVEPDAGHPVGEQGEHGHEQGEHHGAVL